MQKALTSTVRNYTIVAELLTKLITTDTCMYG